MMTDTRFRKERINEIKFQAVLAATKVRDDARFLARVSCWILEPTIYDRYSVPQETYQ